MKFCNLCGTLYAKEVIDGELKFICICLNEEDVGPNDTLMASGVLTAASNLSKYGTIIRNASHDLARHLEKIKCQKCGLDIMTMSRLGENNYVIYTCTCGFAITLDDAIKLDLIGK
jgi:DNA-directed RNA polymerase subunit M/transcription elongation factor TFIIS